MPEKQAIANLRREYTLAGLRRTDLDMDPFAQFNKWFQQAVDAPVPEPNAMTLATANKRGELSSRIVLLKNVDEYGFTFFTNYDSLKGHQLAENPNAALTFFWPELERQICISGAVSKVSSAVSETYFKSRPKGSRLAAWVSNQSTPVENRTALERKLQDVSAKYQDAEVPLPPYWGGYCVAPARIEFWQGRPNRLHDRFQYLRQPDGKWVVERLFP